jgi:hypothetical protein
VVVVVAMTETTTTKTAAAAAAAAACWNGKSYQAATHGRPKKQKLGTSNGLVFNPLRMHVVDVRCHQNLATISASVEDDFTHNNININSSSSKPIICHTCTFSTKRSRLLRQIRSRVKQQQQQQQQAENTTSDYHACKHH